MFEQKEDKIIECYSALNPKDLCVTYPYYCNLLRTLDSDKYPTILAAESSKAFLATCPCGFLTEVLNGLNTDQCRAFVEALGSDWGKIKNRFSSEDVEKINSVILRQSGMESNVSMEEEMQHGAGKEARIHTRRPSALQKGPPAKPLDGVAGRVTNPSMRPR